MTSERINLLLDEALATGAIPAEATPEERAEVERLLGAANALGTSRSRADAEAVTSMPVARARFERFVASSRPAAPQSRQRRLGAGLFGWLFVAHRVLGTAATAAAIAVVATVALLVSQNAFDGVETAAAQVLTPGDYVQVGGVISDAAGAGDQRTVRVASEFGDVEVALSSITSVVDDESDMDPSSIKKGDTVLVSGLVQKDRTIAAQTLAVSADTAPLPQKPKIKELKNFRPDLTGRVVFVGLGEDGQKARAVIDVRGELLLVRINERSLRTLLQSGTSPLGIFVAVGQEPGLPQGVFTLTLIDAPGSVRPAGTPGVAPSPGSPPAGATATAQGDGGAVTPAAPLKFTGFKGIVLGRQGNIVQVESARGVVKVVVRLETRLVIAGSGLAREALTTGDAIVGHEVTISGSLVEGRVIADLIVFGPKIR